MWWLVPCLPSGAPFAAVQHTLQPLRMRTVSELFFSLWLLLKLSSCAVIKDTAQWLWSGWSGVPRNRAQAQVAMHEGDRFEARDYMSNIARREWAKTPFFCRHNSAILRS